MAATAGMLSGGNDSTMTVHAMRRHLTRFVHAGTGVCLSVTRQLVRKVAADLGLPLIIAFPGGREPGRRHRNTAYATAVSPSVLR